MQGLLKRTRIEIQEVDLQIRANKTYFQEGDRKIGERNNNRLRNRIDQILWKTKDPAFDC